MVPVGNKIQMLRQKNKLTQAELATRLGISQAEMIGNPYGYYNISRKTLP